MFSTLGLYPRDYNFLLHVHLQYSQVSKQNHPCQWVTLCHNPCYNQLSLALDDAQGLSELTQWRGTVHSRAKRIWTWVSFEAWVCFTLGKSLTPLPGFFFLRWKITKATSRGWYKEANCWEWSLPPRSALSFDAIARNYQLTAIVVIITVSLLWLVRHTWIQDWKAKSNVDFSILQALYEPPLFNRANLGSQ